MKIKEKISARMWKNIFNSVNDLICILSPDYEILFCNRAMNEFLQLTEKELIGRRCWEVIHSDVKKIKERQTQTTQLKNRWFRIKLDSVFDNEGNLTAIVHTAVDEDERERREDKLKEASLRDELTGLFNRRGFKTLAEQQIKIAHRSKSGLRLLFADLDGLKNINDTLGHAEGDLALKRVADALRDTFRREPDIIARYGGDEFAVLLALEEKSANKVEILISRLRENLESCSRQENLSYTLAISVGFVRYDPYRHSSIDDLLIRADRLMYAQKRANKKRKS